jgi:phenylalanyl-tRNA synthetase beta chain
MVEALVERFDCPVEWIPADDVPFLHPGATARLRSESGDVMGITGEFHPRIAEEYKLTDRAFYCELALDSLYRRPLATPHFESLARFQPVDRDLSFILDKTVSFNRIESQVQALKIPELKAFRLIDLYHGSGLPQGKVSLTVRLTFEAPGRTLTQAEIAERCDLAVAGLRESLAIEMR